MKSQYPMTTHNHITSVLNIFKGRTGKVADAFPSFYYLHWQLPKKQKTNHTANQ